MIKLKKVKTNTNKILLAIVLFFINVPICLAIKGTLLITTTANFTDRFYKNASPSASNNPTTTVIYNRQTFYIIPIVSGFYVKKGKASVVYTLRIKHNGKTMVEKLSSACQQRMVGDTSGVYLCETIHKFELGDTAKSGTYIIEVIITDNISKKRVTLSQEISVQPYTYRPRPFTHEDSFYVWQNYYYEGQEPDRELDGLMFFSQPYMQQKAEVLLPLMAFFSDVFTNRPYLQKAAENLFDIADTNQRLTIIQVFHNAGYMPKSFEKKFRIDEVQYYNQLKNYGLPPLPDSSATNPVVLAMLWGKFFAGGEYTIAKKIVQTLALAQYKGAMGRFGAGQKDEQAQQEAFFESLYQKNVIDLLSRLPNHSLMQGYCLYMLQRADVSALVAQELEAILAPVK